MLVKKAPDIKAKLKQILKTGPYLHVKPGRIFCFRSHGSTARARARIWAFPRIWQLALKIEPAYVIEVLAEKFDHLSDKDKTRVLIHELAHVPKNFSGSLLPHWRRLFRHF